MSFPLQIGAYVVPGPRELGALARQDAGPGGTVLPGRRVWQWVLELIATGVLDIRTAAGLTAALLRNPEGATVAEAARIVGALRDPKLAVLVLDALDAHDTGLLLGPDPADAERSVEDALLRAAAVAGDLADPELRASLLGKLRNAALRVEEAKVLARWGTDDEIRLHLPAILTEGLPAEARADVDARIARGDPGGLRFAEAGGPR